jgi:hypothetical protein
MFERLLTISLGVVGLGMLYLCLRAVFTVTRFGIRGTALVWRLVRCRRICPDCRRLGERCPWCCDDVQRALVGAMAFLVPVVAWPMMFRSHVEFTPQAKWLTGVWATTWCVAALVTLMPGH